MKPIVMALVAPDAAADTRLPALDQFEWRLLHAADVPDYAALSARILEDQPVGLFTVGQSFECFKGLLDAPYAIKRMWIHLRRIEDLTPNMISNNWLHTVHRHELEATNPLVSVFTTTYNSGRKIERPLHSLQAQSYTNWEWILWDDSETSETYEALLQLAAKDQRIKVFRSSRHSGFIGHVKRLAASVCSGEWLVEVDHDDELEPGLLGHIVKAGRAHPEASFVYCDTSEIYEDRPTVSHSYGDHSAFGFAGHVKVWARNQWHIQYLTPEVNPQTLQHIVGVPNHVRAWRRTAYHAVGAHNSLLPVADDYELILRTFLDGSKWIHIPVLGYWQYRNSGGNNFTFKRNALIQHLVAWIDFKYRAEVKKEFVKRLGSTVANGPQRTALCWHDERRQWPSVVHTWLPYDRERTLAIVVPTYNRPQDLRAALESIVAQTDTDWRVYIVGDKCPTLEATMATLARDWLADPAKADFLQQVSYWNLEHHQGRLGTLSRNYALRRLVHTEWVTYLDDDNTWAPNHIASLRPGMVEPHQFVLASLVVEGRPILCEKPVLGRVDSSALCHRTALVNAYQYWPVQNVQYANEIQFSEPWLSKVPFYATKEATVHYNTKYNSQTWASIMALA